MSVFTPGRYAEPTVLPGAPAVLVAMDRDGTTVATAGRDHVVRAWPAGAAEPFTVGHDDAVRSLALSRDGGRLLTVCADGAARVWRTDGTGEPLELWHRGAVAAAAFSPDGASVVTVAEDGTARVWAVDGERLWESVRDRMTIRLRPKVRERYLDAP